MSSGRLTLTTRAVLWLDLGLLGWAQVNGERGLSDTEEKVRRRLRFDLRLRRQLVAPPRFRHHCRDAARACSRQERLLTAAMATRRIGPMCVRAEPAAARARGTHGRDRHEAKAVALSLSPTRICSTTCSKAATLRRRLSSFVVLNDGIGLTVTARLACGAGVPGKPQRHGFDAAPPRRRARMAPRFFSTARARTSSNAQQPKIARDHPQLADLCGAQDGYAQTSERRTPRHRSNRRRRKLCWWRSAIRRQERFIARRGAAFAQSTTFIGVGALFDFMAKAAPRAPQWMRATKLEWLFRLSREPRPALATLYGGTRCRRGGAGAPARWRAVACRGRALMLRVRHHRPPVRASDRRSGDVRRVVGAQPRGLRLRQRCPDVGSRLCLALPGAITGVREIIDGDCCSACAHDRASPHVFPAGQRRRTARLRRASCARHRRHVRARRAASTPRVVRSVHRHQSWPVLSHAVDERT